MSIAERALELLATLLPAGDRARYGEQWAADLRDADEVGLPRRQLLWAAGRIALQQQLRDLRSRRLHSPLPWLVLAIGALIASLYGGATIALNTGDGMSPAFLGVVGLTLALAALRHLSRRVAARAALVSGAALVAEGFAVVWLGHMGEIEIVTGLVVLALGVIGILQGRRAAHAPLRAASLLLRSVGLTLLLASLLGIGGQYLDSRLNAGGFDCLEGFAGDPSTYPDAPATASDIRTGFSWYPLGRTCTWGAGAPAATVDTTTTASTNFQGDRATSDWTYRFGAAGLLTLALAAAARSVRKRALRARR